MQIVPGVICSHRLTVRTSPFHGEDVRANRAESDLYTLCRVAGRRARANRAESDMFPSFNWVGCLT